MNDNNQEDIVSTRIGIYDVLYECDFKANDGHKMYHVKCRECGWESDMKKADISRAKTCNHVGVYGSYINFYYSWKNKRLRSIFGNMKQRCYNKKDKNYKWYGAKGIKICNEWLNNPESFEKWAFDNGYQDKLTIDRKDASKDYNPDNCRWISVEDNSKYKTTTHLIDVDGKVHSGRDWAKILGLSTNIINIYVREYGLDNTIEFIRRYMNNSDLKRYNKTQSIYNLYMT